MDHFKEDIEGNMQFKFDLVGKSVLRTGAASCHNNNLTSITRVKLPQKRKHKHVNLAIIENSHDSYDSIIVPDIGIELEIETSDTITKSSDTDIKTDIQIDTGQEVYSLEYFSESKIKSELKKEYITEHCDHEMNVDIEIETNDIVKESNIDSYGMSDGSLVDQVNILNRKITSLQLDNMYIQENIEEFEKNILCDIEALKDELKKEIYEQKILEKKIKILI